MVAFLGLPLGKRESCRRRDQSHTLNSPCHYLQRDNQIGNTDLITSASFAIATCGSYAWNAIDSGTLWICRVVTALSQGRLAMIPSTAGQQYKRSAQTGNLCLISSFREHLFVALMTPGLIVIFQTPRFIGFGLLKGLDVQHRTGII